MANEKYTQNQVPDKSILDLNGRQAYMGNSYAAATKDVANAGTVEVPVLTLVGGSSIGLASFIQKIKVSTMTAAQSGIVRVYAAPTLVTGAAVNTRNMRIGQANNSSLSVNLVTSASNNGQLIDSVAFGSSIPAILDSLKILESGQRILVTVQTTGAAPCDLAVEFYEC